MNRARPASTSRAAGIVAACGVYAFAGVALALQFSRTDLDWVRAPLSYYLDGPGGDALAAAYVALAAGLFAIGIGFYRAASPPARSAAPMLLFATSAVALAVTGLSEKAKAFGHPAEWELVHLAATETTFLCVTVAMLLQSWWFGRDARWRRHAPAALALAAAAFVALWIYALWHALPHGISQKSVIVLILAWLDRAATRLLRDAKY